VFNLDIYYNLFFRNWLNNRASIEQIEQAVNKNILTTTEATEIMATERKPL